MLDSDKEQVKENEGEEHLPRKLEGEFDGKQSEGQKPLKRARRFTGGEPSCSTPSMPRL
jgi:hypothetical protein